MMKSKLIIFSNYLRISTSNGVLSFKTNSLFRNSVYLMASTAIMSVLGFGFWIFVAHLYSPSQIGIASALISVTALLTNLSMVGLNSGLIRFLPKSKSQSGDINAAILMVAGVSLVASLLYLLVGRRFGANVEFFAANLWHGLLFMLLIAIISVNSLTDAVFIANRRAEFHTLVYSIFGLSRLVLPIFLVAYGAWGIYSSFIIATTISLFLSLFFMVRACNYHIWSKPNWRLLSESRKFATNNYIGVLLAGLPAQIIPLLIIIRLGAAEAAFFSMGWMMANLLYVIPAAYSQSLLAESSHSANNQLQHLKQTVRTLVLTLVPAISISVLIAPYLLRIFGKQYSQGSTTIFQILAVATILVTVNAVANTVLSIRLRTSGIITSQLAGTVVTLGTIDWLMQYGLTGVAVSLVLGMAASNVVQLFLFRKSLFKKHYSAIQPSDVKTDSLPIGLVVLCLKNFGVIEFSSTPLNNGSHNYTFLIHTAQADSELRIYLQNSRTNLQIQNEINFMDFLHQRGLPLPSLYRTSAGDGMATIEIDGYEWQSILMEREAGTHPLHYTDELAAQMGELQAQIHQYGMEYAKQVNDSAVRYELRSGLRRLLLRPYILPFSNRGYSHFDFDSSNILVVNGKISCVLDFEGMRYGLLVECIFFTLTSIYRTGASMDSVRTYIDAYQTIRVLSLFEKLVIKFALVLRFRQPRLLFMSTKPLGLRS